MNNPYPWLYQEGMPNYDGPLEFYWVEYNGLLMIALLLLAGVFKGVYQRSGLDTHKTLRDIFTVVGFGVLFLDIVVEGIRYQMFGFTVFALLFATAYLIWNPRNR